MIDLEEIEHRLNYLRWTADVEVYRPKRWITEREGTLIKDLIQLVEAKSYVEIGTANGFSTMWASLALPEDGKIYTYDIVNRPKLYDDPSVGCTALSSKIEFIENMFEKEEVDRLKNIQHPVVCFVDGDHGEDSVKRNWDATLTILESGDLVVFHDVNSHGVSMAWHDITKSDIESPFYTFVTYRVIGAILYKAESKTLRKFERNFVPETALQNNRDCAIKVEEVKLENAALKAVSNLKKEEIVAARDARKAIIIARLSANRTAAVAARDERRHAQVAARNKRREEGTATREARRAEATAAREERRNDN